MKNENHSRLGIFLDFLKGGQRNAKPESKSSVSKPRRKTAGSPCSARDDMEAPHASSWDEKDALTSREIRNLQRESQTRTETNSGLETGIRKPGNDREPELPANDEVIPVLEAQIRSQKAEINALKNRNEELKCIEKAFPSLLDRIQNIIGYARNQQLCPNKEDELSRFREDADYLKAILEQNGMVFVFDPEGFDNGFLHVYDEGATAPGGIVSRPLILRDGLIIEKGVVLQPPLPPDSETVSDMQEPGPYSKDIELGLSLMDDIENNLQRKNEEQNQSIMNETPSSPIEVSD